MIKTSSYSEYVDICGSKGIFFCTSMQVALTQQGSAEELGRLREELSKERAALRDLEESKEDVQLLCGELEKERSLRAELTRKVCRYRSDEPE